MPTDIVCRQCKGVVSGKFYAIRIYGKNIPLCQQCTNKIPSQNRYKPSGRMVSSRLIEFHTGIHEDRLLGELQFSVRKTIVEEHLPHLLTNAEA